MQQIQRLGIGGIAGTQGNLIAGNLKNGITVTGPSARGNSVRGNDIFDNTYLGIDLGDDGVTFNDEHDGDRHTRQRGFEHVAPAREQRRAAGGGRNCSYNLILTR